MKSPLNTQPVDATPQLAKETQDEAVRAKHTHQAKASLSRVSETHGTPLRAIDTQDDPDVVAAELFSAALSAAGLSSDDVAALFGCSVSLVNRMRNPNARERVSFGQMLRLPPGFHFHLNRQLNQRYGFARAAIARVLDAVGDLAVNL